MYNRTLMFVNRLDKIVKNSDVVAGGNLVAAAQTTIRAEMERLKFKEPQIQDVFNGYAKRVADRIAKADASAHGTCQICGHRQKLMPAKRYQGTRPGRASLYGNAPVMVIAHHGYQRPGYGWQTASCFGARYRPWEVARDALEPYIRVLAGYAQRMEASAKEHRTAPPDELTNTVDIKAHWKDDVHVPKSTRVDRYPRPVDFDTKAVLKGAKASPARETSYIWLWLQQMSHFRTQAANANRTIHDTVVHYDTWKTPK